MGPFAQNAFAIEANITLAGLVNAGEHVEDRGFAGPVGSDQADDFSRVDGKAQFGQGHKAAESYRDVVQF